MIKITVTRELTQGEISTYFASNDNYVCRQAWSEYLNTPILEINPAGLKENKLLVELLNYVGPTRKIQQIKILRRFHQLF